MSAPETKTQEPLRGEKLAKTVVNQILAHPETWFQGAWHSGCGTKHCFAGWSQILGGAPADPSKAQEQAQEFLGITENEAATLFRSNCTISEMYYFAEHFNDAGYNRDGYNRDGYDRAGYNRAGYNRAGYNRDGYNRDGYDRDGYNRAGYNRAGYNRDGYDRDGTKLTPFVL